MSAAGGVMMALAFPEAGLHPLAWICLAPLYLACCRQRPARGFLFGWIFGLALGLSSFSWLAGVMSGYGGLGPWGGAAVLMVLAAFLALYQGLFGWLVAGWDAEGKGFFAGPLLAALFWTGLDWLKAWVFTGFNWTPLGSALAGSPKLIGLCDVIGAYGLGFPVALANFLLAALAVMPRRERMMEAVACASWAAACVIGVALYGIVTYNVWEDEARAARKIDLAVIQASVEQEFKWDARYRREVLGRYSSLAMEAASRKPFLTVWPETAAPFIYNRDPFETAWLRNLLSEAGAPMLVGIAAGDPDPETGRFRLKNRAWLLYPDGKTGPYYDKQHLVPFGEYVPMLEQLPFLRSAFLQGVLGAAGNFSPGERMPPIEYGGVSFGPLICFESIFPYLARRQAQAGADVLLVTTNDAWFGTSWAAAQHFAQASMRAAETRLPLARAANDGISGLISPSGKAMFASPRGAVDVYTLQVPLAGREKPTLYVRGGWLFAPACAASTGLAFLTILIIRLRTAPARRAAKAAGGGKAGGGKGGGGKGGGGGSGTVRANPGPVGAPSKAAGASSPVASPKPFNPSKPGGGRKAGKGKKGGKRK
ncbi:MAG: apolipoprotein N-acyltransferase [Deltaproteobacteria bacterium]|jgi:apolipoprotein N-acyltransferase|nr:apolipoprotein N-acyltransferase [Deltaproteobacteria bacterium]